MKKLVFIFLLFNISLASAEFNFTSKLSEDGEINIQLKFSLDSEISTTDLSKKYLRNEEFQKSIDSMLYSQKMDILSESGDFTKYRLKVTGQKKFKFITVKNTLVFDCVDESSKNIYFSQCKLDTSRKGKDSRDRFHNLSYSFVCEPQASQMICSFDLVGHVKGINLMVYSRTPDRLGASGIQSYLNNMYKLYKTIEIGKGPIKPNLKDDDFYKNVISKVRGQFFEDMDEDDELQIPLKVISSN